MPPVELGLAVMALLLTPGPTNSRMLLAGAERGLAAALRDPGAGLGAALRGGGLRQPPAWFVLRRLASVFLAAMSVLLVLRGVVT